MTPPTPEELLRLARKAWPDYGNVRVSVNDRLTRVFFGWEGEYELLRAPNTKAHAALLVLAGEDETRAELAGAEERGRQKAAAEMLARVDSQGPAVVGRIIEQAEERGRAAERADVVRELRAWARNAARAAEDASTVPKLVLFHRQQAETMDALSCAIERGEHAVVA